MYKRHDWYRFQEPEAFFVFPSDIFIFLYFFRRGMSKLSKSDRWNKKIWLHNSKPQIGRHTQTWLVSLNSKEPQEQQWWQQWWPHAHRWTDALSDDHPTVAQGKVTRKVCIHWSGDCCYSSVQIQVNNCGFYYIYKLHDPGSCNARYCSTD